MAAATAAAVAAATAAAAAMVGAAATVGAAEAATVATVAAATTATNRATQGGADQIRSAPPFLSQCVSRSTICSSSRYSAPSFIARVSRENGRNPSDKYKRRARALDAITVKLSCSSRYISGHALKVSRRSALPTPAPAARGDDVHADDPPLVLRLLQLLVCECHDALHYGVSAKAARGKSPPPGPKIVNGRARTPPGRSERRPGVPGRLAAERRCRRRPGRP